MAKRKKKPAFAWDVYEPLKNLGAESRNSNIALRDYALMGASRSLEKLIRRYQAETKSIPTKRLATLKTWSVKFKWQDRVARWEYLEAERTMELWRERQSQLREADWALGETFRNSLLEFLKQLPRFITDNEYMTTEVDPVTKEKIELLVRIVGLNTNISQLAQAAKTVSELQRLAAELPTDITQELSGAALDMELEMVVSEYLAELLRSAPDHELAQRVKGLLALAESNDLSEAPAS